MNQRSFFGISLLLVVILASACLQQGTFEPLPSFGKQKFFEPSKELNLIKFVSQKELIAFTKQYTVQNQGMLEGDLAVRAPTAIAEEKGADSRSYSPTNNQVANIDEADIIKTDGEYIYTITESTLHVIRAYPGEDAQVISTMPLDHRASNIFIQGNHLVVLGETYGQYPVLFAKRAALFPYQAPSTTFFTIYDMSDKSSLKKLKEYQFEGRYVQARMKEEYVYLAVASDVLYRTEHPTPIIIEDGVERAIPLKEIYHLPIPYNNPQFATIHAIDIADPQLDLESISVVVEGSEQMYMSEDNIYLSYTEYIDEWRIRQEITRKRVEPLLSTQEKALIKKIEASDAEILSPAEKESKVMQVIHTYLSRLNQDEQTTVNEEIEKEVKEKLEQYDYFEYTLINKVAVHDGELEVIGSGKVPGHVINQFSIDEHNGVLRIATTVNPRWSSDGKQQRETSNNVFVLDDELKDLGSLKDLAEGEMIYSTRFIDDRLYMVTFKQIDPFFVIDLSVPTAPKVLGQLKIPGFSRYLHPYDEDTLIGIGRSANEQGQDEGLKISLFDVRNVEQPIEKAKFATDERYAQSLAEFEHKAFLFSKDKELLVIPVYSYNYDGAGEKYNGAFVFKITDDSIVLRGVIDHAKGQAVTYQPLVERSLYIEDLLYTKSPRLIRINAIDDLHAVNDVQLSEPTTYPTY